MKSPTKNFSPIPVSARLLRWWARHGITRWDKYSAFRKLRRYHRGLRTVINTRDNFQLNLVVGDSVDTHLLVHGIFEPIISRVIRERAAQAKTFIDVGCNIGYYSCLYGKYGPKDATILALDANPEMVQRCRENIALNQLQAEVLTLGVADKPGKLQFNLDRRRPSKASFGKPVETAGMTMIEVDVAPLSAILRQQHIGAVDLMKVDIEGYEPALFKGLEEEDARRLGCLIFEYEPDHMSRCGFSPDEIWQYSYWECFDLFALAESNSNPVKFTRMSIPVEMKTVLAINQHRTLAR